MKNSTHWNKDIQTHYKYLFGWYKYFANSVTCDYQKQDGYNIVKHQWRYTLVKKYSGHLLVAALKFSSVTCSNMIIMHTPHIVGYKCTVIWKTHGLYMVCYLPLHTALNMVLNINAIHLLNRAFNHFVQNFYSHTTLKVELFSVYSEEEVVPV